MLSIGSHLKNYRQILGDQADIVMKPEQMKDMFEKGYLDVQRQFTESESNEGIFTIAAKAMATFIGPSKSIGAISIDPKFLEMIKDPNAEIGFGYTRLRQETSLTPLPYPADPPRTETPAQPTTPALQQTDVGVTTPEARTQILQTNWSNSAKNRNSGQKPQAHPVLIWWNVIPTRIMRV